MNLRNETLAVHHVRTACRWGYAAIGLLTFALLGLTCVLDAKKPVDPPPAVESGLIYLWAQTDPWEASVYEVDTSTSTMRALFELPSTYAENIAPAKLDHNGRWFVAGKFLPELEGYPPLPGSGEVRTRAEMFLIDEEGKWLQITNDRSFEPMVDLTGVNPVWVDNDSKIWFSGRKIDLITGAVVSGSAGIYELEIDLTSGTPVAVGQPTFLPWSAQLPVFSSIYTGDVLITFGFAVSSDGLIIYNAELDANENPQLSAYQTIGGSGGWVVHYGPMDNPELSAYDYRLMGDDSYSRAIIQVNVDGTDYDVVASSGRKTIPLHGVWSPTGESIAYSEIQSNKPGSFTGDRVLKVAAADGSGAVTIAEGGFWDMVPLDWVSGL